MAGNATIGIEAVLMDSAFNKGIQNYMSKVDEASTKTTRAASAMSQAWSGLGKVGLVGLTAAAGLAVGALTALAGAMVFGFKGAMDEEESLVKLQAVINATGGAAGYTAEEARKLAEGMSELTRYTHEEIEAGQAVLLRFKAIGHDVFPKATETAVDLAAALGIDVTSAALMLGKALEAPGEGLLRLKAAGVVFTDEQQKMIDKMVEAGDVAGAQKFIMDALGKSVGGTAKLMGTTFAGQIQIMKNRLGEAAEAIGNALMPYMSWFLDNVLKPGVSIVETFATALGDLITTQDLGVFLDNIKEGLTGLVPKPVIDAISSVVLWVRDRLIPALQNLADIILPILNQALQWLIQNWEGVKGALIAVAAVLAGAGIITAILTIVAAINPVTLAIGAIIAAAALLGAAWATNWMGIRDIITSVWDNTLKPFLEGIWEWLQISIPIAIDWLKKKWEELKVKVGEVWDWIQKNIVPKLTEIWNWLQLNIPLAIDWLKTKWEELKVKVGEVWAWIQENVIPKLREIGNWLQVNIPLAIDWLKTKWEELKVKLSEVWSWITENIVPLFLDLQTWLQNKLPGAVEALKGKIGELKTSFETLRKYIADEFLPTFNETKTMMDAKMYSAAQILADKFNTVLLPAIKDLTEFSTQHFMPFLIAVANLLWAALNAATTLAGVIETVLLGAFKEIYNYIKENLNKALEELGLKTKDAGDKVSPVTKILQGFHDVLFRIGQILDTLRQKILDFAAWLNTLAEEIPDMFKPGSPSPFEIALLGIATAAGKAAAGIEQMGKAAKGLPFDALENIFKIGGAYGTFGSAVAGRYQKQTLDPMKARIDAITEAYDKLQEEYKSAGAVEDWAAQYEITGKLNDLFRERERLQAEYEASQERVLALQKQQEDLAFLKSQMDFLKMIKDEGLDISTILGGLKLGLDADLPSLLEAMTRAIREMIDKANAELGAHSPSRVFANIGQNIMAGLAGGIRALAHLPEQAMLSTLPSLVAPAAATPLMTGASYRTANVNMYGTMVNNQMDLNSLKSFILDTVSGAL